MLLLSTLPGLAGDFSWVGASTKNDNQDILEAIDNGSLQEKIEIVRFLGQRSDKYLVEILEYFYYRKAKAFHENELLLQIMLDALFPKNAAATDEKNSFMANQVFLEIMIDNLRFIESPLLKGKIIRIISKVKLETHYSRIAEEGARLLLIMRQTDTDIFREETEEALEILDAIAIIKQKEFRTLCNDFVRWSVNEKIIVRAREVISILSQ